jgi:uncharacterized protein with NRDE domain
MCLIAFAWNASPQYRLVLAANRDEFHDRPADAARWWGDTPHIFGGRDLSAGGTWLALSATGRLAAVTNFRDRPHRGAGTRSRGELATSFLTSEIAPYGHAMEIATRGNQYGGFNLLLFDWRRETAACVYLSNRHPEPAPYLPDNGIHTVSNHLLNTPWPKAERLRRVMANALLQNDPIEQLFDALADSRPVSPSELPSEGDFSDPDVLTRTPFIADSRYGTRASTVVTVNHQGDIRFVERTWRWSEQRPVCTGERRLEM